MMEKNMTYKNYEKKIVPYLDGSLAQDELAEFEAFVLTHPEFEEKIKVRKEEIQLLKDMIPAAMITPELQESLEVEIKASIFNLLKEEPQSFIDTFRIKWEEYRNRN